MEINNKINPDFMLRKAMQRSETPSPELITKIRYNTIKERPHVKSYYRSRKIVAIAAVMATLAAFSTAALATNFFGLRNTALPAPEVGDNVHGIIVTQEMADDPENSWIIAQPFALQGFEGSPEHAALAEWMAFLYQYDTDGSMRAAIGNNMPDIPDEYLSYNAFNMEMVEKINEIMEKYDLKLKGRMVDTKTQDELQMVIADGAIFTDDSIWFNGSVYESGSYWFEGQYDEYMFSFRSSQKGVFCDVYTANRDNDFDEWIYTNKNGTELLLSQSISSSTIITETETAFIMMKIGAGTEGNPHDTYTKTTPFNRSDFENLADMIDFRQLRIGTPDPARLAEIQSRRSELSAAVSSIVGKWDLVRSESNDGSALPIYTGEEGLKINDERMIYIWRGTGVLENHENWSSDFVWKTEFWQFDGEVTALGGDEYSVQIAGCMGNFDDDFLELIRYKFPPAYLQFDSNTGLLRYTDLSGNNHFYTRAS